MAKEWIYKPKVETGSIDAARLNVPQLLAQILANRGLTDEAAAEAFLKPELAHLHDPSLLPDIDKAVGRIIQAVKGGEPIVIYGDYDVDGIAGSAILHHTLGMLGAVDVPVYVPHRLEEGYGVNADALRLLAKRGTRLVITVDCGITSIEEAAVARELGMDLIITDHHEPSPAGLPDAVALVNPKAPHSTYPFRSLSGSGVAFKVAWALGQELSPTRRVSPEFKEFLISATALAALGTVADVVPLVDENRALTHFGLRALSASNQPGIVALMETAGCSNREMKAGHIAFGLAPRLNAAGRMGRAQDAVDLLTTTDPAVATRLAGLLEEQNVLRQKTEKRIAEEAIEKVGREVNLETDRIIVLAEEGWHPGVIGIVASRVLERFGRPAVLIALTDGRGQGSARSIPGFSIFDAIADSADLLTSFGGHDMAAGLRFDASQFDLLRARLLKYAEKTLSPTDMAEKLNIDAGVTLPEITPQFTQAVAMLAPFGRGNPQPVLACDNVRLTGPASRFGRAGNHLAFHVTQDGRTFRAVGWRLGTLAEALTKAGTCAIAFTPRFNNYRGEGFVELELRDIWLGRYGQVDTQPAGVP